MNGPNMKKLFYDRIIPKQKHIPKTQEYEDTSELFNVAEEELREQMSAGMEAMYIDCRSYAERLAMLQNEECFMQGRWTSSGRPFSADRSGSGDWRWGFS